MKTEMTNKEIHLILGGCRSGKSRHALETADMRPAGTNLFVATCVPADEEMKARVMRHQQERDSGWTTLEAPLALPGVIRDRAPDADVIIIDCLTLWVNNLMERYEDDESLMDQVRSLGKALEEADCRVLIVSNEVGGGVVPENAVARRFRDLSGFTNQHIAACANRVTWMVAGIPVAVR